MEPTIVLLWLLAAALILVGLAGAVLPAIPGVPLVFAGLWLAAWIDDYARVSGWTLGVLGVLTLLAMVVDVAASALGAQRVGASRQAIAGAAIGALVGVFFGLVGLLVGPFVGAVFGELAARGSPEQAARVGVATWLGLLFGTLLKLALSLAMVGIFTAAYFL
jgi:uncharacterized protein YqgC (DUF456 family)